MTENPKKMLPKFKKKFSGFLSDEGGKITKEDVLKLSMMAMGVGGAAAANAGYYCDHSSSAASMVGSSAATLGTVQSKAWSKTVNGHANAVLGFVGVEGTPGHNNTQSISPHASGCGLGHSSHSSHGSHGQW